MQKRYFQPVLGGTRTLDLQIALLAVYAFCYETDALPC